MELKINKNEIDKRLADLFIETFGFDEAEYDYFLSHFTKKLMKKKQLYSTAGHVANSKAYINKGCARTFVIDEAGNEKILYFSFEDFWLCDFESFSTGLPGKHNVEMLEDSELLIISKTDWEKLEKEITKMSQWYVRKVARSAGAMLNRLAEVKIDTPEERYLNLLKTKPYIFQRIPLKHIAAFLDIQPQSLSRMRKRLLK